MPDDTSKKHQINLPESEFKMLIKAYEDRLWKHIKPIQRFVPSLQKNDFGAIGEVGGGALTGFGSERYISLAYGFDFNDAQPIFGLAAVTVDCKNKQYLNINHVKGSNQ